MYKCDNCRSIFENPNTDKEPSGEKWNICPFCDSADISELKEPKEIEPYELLEMLVNLCAAYNQEKTSKSGALEYEMDRVRKFIADTVNDIDLYSDLKVCRSNGTAMNVIDYIFKVYEGKE